MAGQTHSNHVWAMDFVHDQLATGRKIRVLTVVDTFSRFSPAVDARFSYRGEDVVQTLERVCRQIGYPASIRVDNGSEFISRDLDLWAYHKGIVLDFSRPGKPGLFVEPKAPLRPIRLHATNGDLVSVERIRNATSGILHPAISIQPQTAC